MPSDLPTFLGQLDEGNFTGVRMNCKPRANNSLFRAEKGFSQRTC